MIASLAIRTVSGNYDQPIDNSSRHKCLIDVGMLSDQSTFDIVITFQYKIAEFRNHDYSWIKLQKSTIAGEFSPKIIKLINGILIQPNISLGIWEVNKSNPYVLYWRFNPESSAVLTNYQAPDNARSLIAATQEYNFEINPALLFSNSAVEFSRSPLPFSAITCFTDHCDYDTLSSLEMQRNFFKKHSISVTKGFFLNHYSKREDNASFENEASELLKWQNDGHELAYHSLSQSIKPLYQSMDDFTNFQPPFKISTWIDHGFQPYNLSLFHRFEISAHAYQQILERKNIKILWNYIDSGTSTLGVINQLNSQDFTIASFSKGNRDQTLSIKIRLMLKNIMFHFYTDEKLIVAYKGLAGDFKKFAYEKKWPALFSFGRKFLTLAAPITKACFMWPFYKQQPYKLVKYTPLIFRHTVDGIQFRIFQTVEMVDFKKSLDSRNIDKLIAESGIFIAHTYFSAPLSYHTGKMFKTPNTIDEIVDRNFKYLGDKIQNKKIWNPTLIELSNFLTNFEKCELDIDAQGLIYVKNASSLKYRNVI